MFDPSKRIVIEGYAGLLDEELDVILKLVKEKLEEIDFPKYIKKTLVVRIDEDPFFKDEE